MATHKGECFCEAIQLEVSGNPKGWVIVIADHAVRGPVDQSMPLRSGGLRLCESQPVQNMLACSRKQQLARGNTAKNVEAI